MTTKVAHTLDYFEQDFMAAINGEDEDEALVDHHGLPRTRSSALYRGSPEYSTGKSCIDGHRSPRETASGRCLECKAEGDRGRAEILARRTRSG